MSGIDRLSWRRSFAGIPAFGDELRVAMDANGAVLSASGGPSSAPPSLTPSLSAAQAMAIVSDDAAAAAPPPLVTGPRGVRRTTTFAGGGRAQLVVFGSRLAWEVGYPALPSAFYDTLVDAATGAILRRANLVKSFAKADVWNDHPDASDPLHLDLETLGYLPLGATTLQNAWMRVFADADGSDSLDPGEEVPRPTNTPFAFTPAPGCDPAKPCAWNPADPTHWDTNREQVAVQAFYLANRFREWLAAAPIGFDGFGSSVPPLDIETDWGADFAGDPDAHPDNFDNSAMLIPSPVDSGTWAMELSLFGVTFSDGNAGFRAIDAGDDASIVDHEYTHGFTNQTVVDGGSEALNTAQAWAIDEASADFFAKSYLVDKGFETDTAARGDIDMGDYTDLTPHSIRTQALDCPIGATSSGCPRGGYTYASFGHVINRPEPHADGEIWAETMWDLRGALPAGRATELAAKALAISPPEPSFLDMRDAILTADSTAGYGDAATIWQVFAHRGMGCDARTNGSEDTRPVAGFIVGPCAPAPTPTPTPVPTVSPTAAPVVTPTPPHVVPKPPSFTLQSAGRRSVKFTVTCRAACSVTGTLSISRTTAKRLHLGSRRVVGKFKTKLTAAGHRTLTVRLNTAAARALKRAKKLKSFKATLTAQAVYPGAVVAFKHRTVTVRR